MFEKVKTIYNKKKLANTLSETLIALTVLGIVFTLCTGVMLADYNKNQTVVRLKKMYSVLSQAFDRAVVTSGSPQLWDFPSGNSAHASYQFFETYLLPYLILSRDCKNSTQGSCDFEFKELNGVDNVLSSAWTRFFLNDGSFVAMQTIGDRNYKVVYFYVDTNGKKRLNVVGRDIFLFEYWVQNDKNPEYEGTLRPLGFEYTRDQIIAKSANENNCTSTGNGSYCAALIMKDNWQIIRGYPWAQARYVVQ